MAHIGDPPADILSKDHNEFISAHAADDIRTFKHILQYLGGLLQVVVSVFMAEAVIGQLQMVQVQIKNGIILNPLFRKKLAIFFADL